MKADENLAVIDKVLKQKEHLALLERDNIKKTAERLEEIMWKFEERYKEGFYLWDDWPDKETLHPSVVKSIDNVRMMFDTARDHLHKAAWHMEEMEQRWKETIS